MSATDVTTLLIDWSQGDRSARDRLMPLVYDQLRVMAARYMGRENQGHTLQRTALVHEAYFKLIDQDRVQWRNRAQCGLTVEETAEELSLSPRPSSPTGSPPGPGCFAN